MSNSINVDIDLADTETQVIQVNRYGTPEYAINIKTGSALVEGTLDQVNRAGVTPTWSTLDDKSGTALTAAVPGSGVVPIQEVALEAIRITATGATTGKLMQQGNR